jgi:hypothetical protein
MKIEFKSGVHNITLNRRGSGAIEIATSDSNGKVVIESANVEELIDALMLLNRKYY